MVEAFGHARRARAQPVMMEFEQSEPASDRPEGVHVAMAEPRPAVEFDPELDRALGGGEKFILVDAERLVEQADLRNRSLADADRRDRVRFDQPDRPAFREEMTQAGGGHPARRSSADDDQPHRGHLISLYPVVQQEDGGGATLPPPSGRGLRI